MIAHLEDRKFGPVLFVIINALLITPASALAMLVSSLGTMSWSFRHTSAKDRPDEIRMCSTAIICEVKEPFVVAGAMSHSLSHFQFRLLRQPLRHAQPKLIAVVDVEIRLSAC